MYANGELHGADQEVRRRAGPVPRAHPGDLDSRQGVDRPRDWAAPGDDVVKVQWGDYTSDLAHALLKTLEYTVLGFIGAVLLGLGAGTAAAGIRSRLVRLPGGRSTPSCSRTSRCWRSSSSPTSAWRRSDVRLAR